MLKRRLVLPAIAGVLAALAAVSAEAAQVHADVPLTGMYYQYLTVPAGAARTWATTNLSAGADTVIHVWDPQAGVQLGYSDDVGSSLASSVTFTNTTGAAKTVMLIVRSYSSSTNGTARLLQNGATLVNSLPIGGKRLDIENGPGWVHETVMAPGGARFPWMIALASNGHALAIDFNGGVEFQARISHPSAARLVVGTSIGSGGVHVYSNDPSDGDDDGLGTGLEWELGTCDSAAWSGCDDVNNLQDTDRDGIADTTEVLGIDDVASPQHMAAYGADPLHKDVFVELDWVSAFASNPFTEQDAIDAQAIYAAGLAADLVNPDGLDGVRLHLDMDRVPSDPSLATLLGDWGGSNSVPAGTSYQSASTTYRAAARVGVFRYGLLDQGNGGGQANGDRFGWGVSVGNRYVRSFAHELGHTAGLAHHGHDSWGNANGKANYLSLMNYAYPGSEFSQGENTVVLNPAVVAEVVGIGTDAAHVGQWPFSRLIGPNDEVDWDFDGGFSGSGWSSLRAPVTYATSGTSALSENEQDLHSEADLPATTPALVKGPGNRMYAFYVDDARIWYRHGLMNGASYFGSCPGGDDIGDACTTWSAAIEVPTVASARGVTAVFTGGQMLLAFRTTTDAIRTIRASGVAANGTLQPWSAEVTHAGTTNREPEIEVMRVAFGGATTAIGIVYRDAASGQYRWRTMSSVTSTSSTFRGALLDDGNAALSGSQSPTLANWPYDPLDSADGRTCAAITDPAGVVGFYCYDPALNRFVDLSASAFSSPAQPITSAKPGLAYHAYRSWAGIPQDDDDTRGAFWMSVVVADPKWDYVDVWISDPISDDVDEALDAVTFPVSRRGPFGNVWSNMVDGAGLALYDDPSLGAMKALWLRQDGGDHDATPGAVKVRFLPLADGTFRAQLEDGNDFQVMERGICRGIAGDGYCGASSFGLD